MELTVNIGKNLSADLETSANQNKFNGCNALARL